MAPGLLNRSATTKGRAENEENPAVSGRGCPTLPLSPASTIGPDSGTANEKRIQQRSVLIPQHLSTVKDSCHQLSTASGQLESQSWGAAEPCMHRRSPVQSGRRISGRAIHQGRREQLQDKIRATGVSRTECTTASREENSTRSHGSPGPTVGGFRTCNGCLRGQNPSAR